MLRVCLVGTGSFARVHAAWWRRQPGANLVAVATRDPGSAGRDPEWRGSALVPESAIGDPGRPWDLVDIVTPPGCHAAQAIAALEAGYHVLCEKPLAIRSVDAERMITAAENARRRLFVVCQYRFVPAYRVLKSVIERARPASIRVEYTMPPEAAGLTAGSWKADPALSGGGIAWSSGVHLVDLLLWWLGLPDGEVIADSSCTLPGIPVVSRYRASWRAGGTAVLLTSSCLPGLPHRTTVTVESAAGSMLGRVVDWRIQRATSPISWKWEELALGLSEKLRPHRRDPLGRQMTAIRRALGTGVPTPYEALSGLEAVRIIERIEPAGGQAGLS